MNHESPIPPSGLQDRVTAGSVPSTGSDHDPSAVRSAPPDGARRLVVLADGVLGPGLDHAPPGGVLVSMLVEPGANPRAWIESIADAAPGAVPPAGVIDRRGWVLMPALINAHAHLDLTHMGPCPADPLEPGSPSSSFAAFGTHVLSHRLDEGDAIRRSVGEGARLSLLGGVAAVGDIAGVWRTEPLDALRRSGLRGVSYLEVFGHGDRVDPNIARLEQIVERVDSAGGLDAEGCRLGLSPHAPYSASRRMFDACAALAERRGMPVATHLAECPEEREFVASARGPIRALLERLGGVDAETEREFSRGHTPIEHIGPALSPRWSAVHVNDCDEAGLAAIARSGATVVYCPRASAYFAHERHFGPHRYRQMLAAGVPVALGTDSIICLPSEEADRLCPLDDARFLHRRDGTDPAALLLMLYEHGARAIGIDAGRVRWPSGPPFVGPTGGPAEMLGVIAVEALAADGPSAGRRAMSARGGVERFTTETR